MSGFFRSWRSGLGVCLLLLTCLLTMGWIRSQRMEDAIGFAVVEIWFLSVDGRIGCAKLGPNLPFWISNTLSERRIDGEGYLVSPLGLRLCGRDDSMTGETDFNQVSPVQARLGSLPAPRMVRYWMLVIPLTLSTAFLLIDPCRRMKATNHVK
jgi:hypothetical protein